MPGCLPVALILLTLAGCASRPSQLTMTARPIVSRETHLQSPAIVELVFTNGSNRPLILPTGRVMLDRNLFMRLYRPSEPNPFPAAKPVYARSTPPFQLPTDDVVTIPPGGTHTYRFESFIRWITFSSGGTADELRAGGDEWLLIVHFTGKYIGEPDAGDAVWRTPVTSRPMRVKIRYQ